MLAYRVNDMSCGHCVNAITRAVQGAVPTATVQVDLATHLVHVEAGTAEARVIEEAIREAGYTPQPA